MNNNYFKNLKEKTKNFFDDKYLDKVFQDCFYNTIDTTCQFEEDGSVFVITGDIPAMWLRDSAAQVMQYLFYLENPEVDSLIQGVIKKQLSQILIDPYSNAFMHDENCHSEWEGTVDTDYLPKIIWERKYELDSLCYPFFLLSKYYEQTKNEKILDDLFIQAFDKVIETARKEQHHSQLSTYYFYRFEEKVGKNTNPNEEKGLIWSGFRPSDDACKYNYHIPDNMFFVSILDKLESIFKTLNDAKRADICKEFKLELKELIDKYGVIEVEGFGKVYVSETNCLGEYTIDDDANIPSLLSIPYLEYPYIDKKIYENTRRYILSKNNKYYYEGSILKGIGSPHTPANRVWPLALSMQGITSNDENEIKACFNMLVKSANNGTLMHEGVDVNDTSVYSRPWFAWANSLFSYFCIVKKDIINN